MAELIEDGSKCEQCFDDTAEYYYIPHKKYMCESCIITMLEDNDLVKESK